MKAMMLRSPRPIEQAPLEWSDVTDPAPRPGEARVKVRCCAACRTDLHVIEGDLHPPALPIIPGHQVVGIVDALGPQCRRMEIGKRVGIAWLRHTCGACRFCTVGRENLCESSRYTGFHADGGYAEYALVPEDFAYELPDGFDDVTVAPLLCAGIIGYRAMLRCKLRRGEALGLFGFGSSAHVVLQLARHRGHEVFVVTRGAAHQQLARDLGAAWAGPDASALPRRLGAAIVFAPSGAVVPPALASLDRGGTLALAGIHMSPIPLLDYDTYLFNERDVHPVTANTRADGRALLTEAAAAGVRPHTTVFPLRDANRALADLKAGRVLGTAVLVVQP